MAHTTRKKKHTKNKTNMIKKKLFKHGGSLAIDIPMAIAKKWEKEELIVESLGNDQIVIHPSNELDSLESDPLFHSFIQAIAHDALKHPEKLKNPEEVWDKEWQELLDGVEADED